MGIEFFFCCNPFEVFFNKVVLVINTWLITGNINLIIMTDLIGRK